jgi:hypothetical protein
MEDFSLEDLKDAEEMHRLLPAYAHEDSLPSAMYCQPTLARSSTMVASSLWRATHIPSTKASRRQRAQSLSRAANRGSTQDAVLLLGF